MDRNVKWENGCFLLYMYIIDLLKITLFTGDCNHGVDHATDKFYGKVPWQLVAENVYTGDSCKAFVHE